MSPHSSSSGKDSGAARVLGSGTSGQWWSITTMFFFFYNTINYIDTWSFLGVAELLIFHPVDTVAKRLMSNKAKVCVANLFFFNDTIGKKKKKKKSL